MYCQHRNPNSLKCVHATRSGKSWNSNIGDDPGRSGLFLNEDADIPKECKITYVAASADGKLLLPYVDYQALNLYGSWTSGGIKGARSNRIPSDWFDSSLADWVKKIAIPYLKNLPGKKYLIRGNLSSHFSVDIEADCKDHTYPLFFCPSTQLT